MGQGERKAQAPGYQKFNVTPRKSAKHNGKFQIGTKAFEERKTRLAQILAALSRGESISQLQAGGVSK